MTGNKYELSEKIVIIINGKGGVGKDTLCNAAHDYYSTRMISAITPVKEIAQRCGWNGEKDKKSRKFLSDLKRLLIDYNDLPTTYLVKEYKTFLNEDIDILFVQIREKDQIEAFRSCIQIKNYSLLIMSDRDGLDKTHLGNVSDDEVESFEYDYIFWNNEPIEKIGECFCRFLYNLFTLDNINIYGR
ncbi:MAG: hypothetical protein HFG71_13480 [Hungatella sp.]|jgi:hypothetical protein|nr:hypothetical protein [Hungatella sp.]